MSPYKIIVRKSRDWRLHTHATLGVSVLSPNWQDEKFAAILHFCGKHFVHIRIDVTDELYRHNFRADGMATEEAHHHAHHVGTQWLAAHRDLIDKCAAETHIVRWGEWYGHADFKGTLAAFERSHSTNSILREAVDHDAHAFCRRRELEPTLTRLEHCRNLLLEELAVSTLQAAIRPRVKIYPGDELESLRVVRNGLVTCAPRGLELEQFAKITFQRIGGTNIVSKLLPDRHEPHGKPGLHHPTQH